MRLGIVGLGRMGAGLAQAAIEHGHDVVGHDPGAEGAKALVGRGLVLAATLEELIDELSAPRIVLVYVPHGDPTERVCAELRASASAGDVVVDGGNSHWEDSRRRHREFAQEGIRFVDVGTSGGLCALRRVRDAPQTAHGSPVPASVVSEIVSDRLGPDFTQQL